jgi:hypothetical protein
VIVSRTAHSSRGVLRRIVLLLLAAAVLPLTARAQGHASDPRVEILLPRSVGGVMPIVAERGPRITAVNVLSEGELRELIRSGFPGELRFRLELWRAGGWFDDLEAVMEWEVVIAYDPASQLYRVRRLSSTQNEDLGVFATLTSVEAVLARPLRAPLVPSRMGRRYYYNLVLEVEALSVSDLDQLERWLRGELRPAVRGRNNPVNAISSGVRTIVTRVLGAERREYRRRSGSFRAG